MSRAHAPSRNRSRGTGRRTLAAAGLAIYASLAGAAVAAGAQDVEETDMPARLAIFLDCGFCDETFIRQEMTYVDYVRDREVADVHVLVTEERTGAGGAARTLDLIGQGPFEGMDYSTVHKTSVDATQAEQRDGFLRTLQASLVPCLMRTPVGERLTITVDAREQGGTGQTGLRDDPWDNWRIEVYWDGSADFESRQRSFDTRYGVYVDRVTEDWKIQLRPFFNYDYVRFERDDETITSTSRRDGVTSYVIRSISSHWSVGAFGDVFSSTFDNVDARFRLMPPSSTTSIPTAKRPGASSRSRTASEPRTSPTATRRSTTRRSSFSRSTHSPPGTR